MEAKEEEGRWAEENTTPHDPSATTRPSPSASQSPTSHHPRVLPPPQDPHLSPETPGAECPPPLRHLPTPAGRRWQEGTSFPDLSLLEGGGSLLGRGDGDSPPPGLSARALLRMCLPDILCPRVSPEGPERPARTEDASRGESRPFQGPGAEQGLNRGREPPAFRHSECPFHLLSSLRGPCLLLAPHSLAVDACTPSGLERSHQQRNRALCRAQRQPLPHFPPCPWGGTERGGT